MGASSSVYETKELAKLITKKLAQIQSKIQMCDNRISELDNSINIIRNHIDEKINRDDHRINGEVNEFYNLLNKKSEINGVKGSYENVQSNLNDLYYENKNAPNIINTFTRNQKLISNTENYDKIINSLEYLIEKDEKISKNKIIPKDVNSKDRENIFNFLKLKDKVILEIKGINDRRNSFIKKFNEKIYDSFIYPSSLQNALDFNLNNMKKSFNNFQNNLNSYNKEIISEIKNNLYNPVNSYNFEVKYNTIKNNIDDANQNQTNLENNSL